ncbi:ABC transporter ATP-binding protein [Nocardioides immobilis]|uniref:ABC transporter ATP-binding protein n=1 Tax=Nocardioides immobilis TaxID=2049295 RepID=A0A417Y5Z5_9ACTN|nr:ABC transporter ATP-binding protein [Nocardioides immobilis]RHW28118.1 ABC transporter ATP-binding protein [Nocardioides immobilis]
MSAANAAALELRGVSARYGPSVVLRDVDLSVRPGETVALLGPNGAGKTTLLRSAAGLPVGVSGSVYLGGSDVTRARSHRRSRAGLCLVPEGRAIFPNLTVAENIRLHGRSGREAAERVFEAFPILAERRSQRAGLMSGGQQQMLALARCLTTDPQVVLLDEVSMGLAPRIVDEIFDALQLLARSGVAILLVEQYVGKALAMADRVYVLDRGRISWTGTPSETSEDDLMNRYLSVDAGS